MTDEQKREELNKRYQDAIKAGFSHCVSFIYKHEDPQKPWRQNFFKSMKGAKDWEKWILEMGGRAIVGGMRPSFPG